MKTKYRRYYLLTRYCKILAIPSAGSWLELEDLGASSLEVELSESDTILRLVLGIEALALELLPEE